jgi:hypothetical protein
VQFIEKRVDEKPYHRERTFDASNTVKAPRLRKARKEGEEGERADMKGESQREREKREQMW